MRSARYWAARDAASAAFFDEKSPLRGDAAAREAADEAASKEYFSGCAPEEWDGWVAPASSVQVGRRPTGLSSTLPDGSLDWQDAPVHQWPDLVRFTFRAVVGPDDGLTDEGRMAMAAAAEAALRG